MIDWFFSHFPPYAVLPAIFGSFTVACSYLIYSLWHFQRQFSSYERIDGYRASRRNYVVRAAVLFLYPLYWLHSWYMGWGPSLFMASVPVILLHSMLTYWFTKDLSTHRLMMKDFSRTDAFRRLSEPKGRTFWWFSWLWPLLLQLTLFYIVSYAVMSGQ